MFHWVSNSINMAQTQQSDWKLGTWIINECEKMYFKTSGKPVRPVKKVNSVGRSSGNIFGCFFLIKFWILTALHKCLSNITGNYFAWFCRVRWVSSQPFRFRLEFLDPECIEKYYHNGFVQKYQVLSLQVVKLFLSKFRSWPVWQS